MNEQITCAFECERVKTLSALTDEIALKIQELKKSLISLKSTETVCEESAFIRDQVLVKMRELRVPCDEAETITARKYWPFPTYGELLFGVK